MTVNIKKIAILMLMVATATYLYPLFFMLFRSISDSSAALAGDSWGFTLENYRTVLGGAGFSIFALNSLIVLFFVVAGNIVFSVMCGYALTRYTFPGKKIFFSIILGTLMIPRQVLAVPILDLMTKIGLHNSLSAMILPFLADSFNIFLIRQYLQGIPKDLEEAARVDGATELQVLLKVVFPICRPALALIIVNTTITTWNSFLFPLILTDSADKRTLPVGLSMFTQGPFSTDWGALMAGAAVSSLPIILIFLVFQREIIAGITSGALKD
ncbi:MAG: carbohydrate ABC transporter permease [Candidatus Riflebacteria bacterium]|nr:carbohydrate ABC transporter permease [Candidatus Riflebacteria bacterium]